MCIFNKLNTTPQIGVDTIPLFDYNNKCELHFLKLHQKSTYPLFISLGKVQSVLLLLLPIYIITHFWILSSQILDFTIDFRKEVLCVNNIKERLTALGKSQIWLLRKLRDKGIEVQPPQLCNIINGNYTYPKAQKVLEICNDVLTEVENAT